MDIFHRDKFGDMEISSWRFSYRYFFKHGDFDGDFYWRHWRYGEKLLFFI